MLLGIFGIGIIGIGIAIPRFVSASLRLDGATMKDSDSFSNENVGKSSVLSGNVVVFENSLVSYAMFQTFKHVTSSIVSTVGGIMLGYSVGFNRLFNYMPTSTNIVVFGFPLVILLATVYEMEKPYAKIKRRLLDAFVIYHGLLFSTILSFTNTGNNNNNSLAAFNNYYHNNVTIFTIYTFGMFLTLSLSSWFGSIYSLTLPFSSIVGLIYVVATTVGIKSFFPNLPVNNNSGYRENNNIFHHNLYNQLNFTYAVILSVHIFCCLVFRYQFGSHSNDEDDEDDDEKNGIVNATISNTISPSILLGNISKGKKKSKKRENTIDYINASIHYYLCFVFVLFKVFSYFFKKLRKLYRRQHPSDG